MGRKKSSKGTVSITNDTNRIRLRWRVNGSRYSLNLNSYNKRNLINAKSIALMIEVDLRDNTFDTTLIKYSPKVESELKLENLSNKKSISNWFEIWTKEVRNMNCEINVDYNATRNMMVRWGSFDNSTVLNFLSKETFNENTYNKRLGMLNLFYKWLAKNKLVIDNPFDDVSRKRTKKKIKTTRQPFTAEEINKVLKAFSEDEFSLAASRFKHSFYYPFLYFIFRTGVRNGEAIGLLVKHVHLERRVIEISESLSRTLKGSNASSRIRKETKNGKVRYLPLTDDLLKILIPQIKGKDKTDLVFPSPKGLCIDDQQFQKRVFKKVLQGLGISPRVLYACRHTFGSRCIASGLDPIKTSSLMGNNAETVLRNYVHPFDIPDVLPTWQNE